MAGGYFELPISSSRRSSLTDTSGGGGSRLLPGPRASPIPLASNGSCAERPSESTGAQAQARVRNAGILKPTNRVKFTMNEPEGEEVPSGSTSDTQPDGRGLLLPQRPLPIANIPPTEKSSADHQSLPLVVTSSYASTADVTGLSIHSRASSPGILDDDGISRERGRAIHFAQGKAQRLASLLRRSQKSPKRSPHPSLPSSTVSTPIEVGIPGDYGDDIPMISLSEKQSLDYSTDEDEEGPIDRRSTTRTSKAHNLVQQMTRRDFGFLSRVRAPSPGLSSGQAASLDERDTDTYGERPSHYRGGILSSLLKLYDNEHNSGSYGHWRYGSRSRQGSEGGYSGRGVSPDPIWPSPQRPRKWYDKSPNVSTTSLAGSTAKNSETSPISGPKRSRSSGALGIRRWTRPQLEDEIRITVHIAELLSRQRYLLLLCQVLLNYGAPTHRLEEYMRMTARVLEIDGQFLYIPGCMIISFDDASTHTTEVKIVRSPQGVDLGKMADVHEVYKEVIHDVIGVEEAIQRLEEIKGRDNKFPVWFQIFMHGCACAAVGPFAFGARPIDLPIAFLLGTLVGTLQLVLSPRSQLYSNVFEISAAVLTSFLARAFGSIRYHGEHLFCFAALAQSSIALILPGYLVLSASLELQSRSMVAGSVRMVYAIMYSLFLGFGITIGTSVYGLLDTGATDSVSCPASPITNEYLQHIPFVIIFTFCLSVVNQSKWRQVPIMLFISLSGYVVNYFSIKRFFAEPQVANALGAFVIGVIGNLYSRIRHGLAAAAMLPAIFVLVPSGLAASGSLVSGLSSAEQMAGSSTTVITNGTQGFVAVAKNMTSTSQAQNNGLAFDIAYGMIQVAVGFTVGLFLAALVVYPLGKKRSGLFSF
ncbi:hypothetical protein ASPZODRAFT_71852 [Penicilliopsis zonata CBS 506.65]|uniref:Threonine/serine exporter-like N-terminal domain-containing protein n=1 Tax=Penicilliopsis zonata CBS 506.65 TaxID=1073090 RepID=A0A1L9SB29_9EURO|nr:hypothetical protein ASPZODRAFT_71852 [Penicilliopsis zonata CBS 506.65]OJJ44385.1 hypothetical protein ASPZODRAFT_71852 [Penicilliopsis zonata CBS 506.65]